MVSWRVLVWHSLETCGCHESSTECSCAKKCAQLAATPPPRRSSWRGEGGAASWKSVREQTKQVREDIAAEPTAWQQVHPVLSSCSQLTAAHR